MTESHDPIKVSLVRRLLLLAGFGVVWMAIVFAIVLSSKRTPEQRYADWLEFQRGPRTTSTVERIAGQLGIRAISQYRSRAHRRATLELVKDPEYALAVRSWFHPIGYNPVLWPDLKKAVITMAAWGDPDRFLAALHRCDADGPLQWELTLLRSAEAAEALDEVDEVEEVLNEWVEQQSPGSPMGERFADLATLYRLPLPQLIQRIIEEPSGSPTVADIQKIMSTKPMEGRQGFQEWFFAAKKAPPPSEDRIVRLLKITEAREIRSELLVWILTAKETEDWRTAPNRDLSKFLRNCLKADRPTTWKAVGDSINQIADSEGRTSDWQTTARHLLSLILAQRNPASDISKEAGRSFVWLAHLLDDEPLLLRGIELWDASLPRNGDWIGAFLEKSQFSAVAALAKANPQRLNSIKIGADHASSKTPNPLSYFVDLSQKVEAHCETESLRSFVSLVISARAEQIFKNTPEREESSKVVQNALARFDRIQNIDPEILKVSLRFIAWKFPQRLGLVPTKLQEWSGHPTVDDAVQSILDGSDMPDQEEREIWSAFVRKAVLPGRESTLVKSVELVTREGPGSEIAQLQLTRIGQLLRPDQVSSDQFEIRATLLIGIISERMIKTGPPADSVPWMFERIRELRAHNSAAAEEALTQCYGIASGLFRERPREDAWRWYFAVVDQAASGGFGWPDHLPYDRRGWGPSIDPHVAAQLLEENMANHPLRTWIARLALENDYGVYFGDDSKRYYQLVKESATSEWLGAVADDIIRTRPVDLDSLRSTLASLPSTAEDFFVEKLMEGDDLNQYTTNSWTDGLAPEERLQLLLWEGDVLLNRFDINREIGSAEFEYLFRNLLGFSGTFRTHDGLISLAKRLHECSFTSETGDLDDWEVKRLKEWQQKTAWINDP